MTFQKALRRCAASKTKLQTSRRYLTTNEDKTSQPAIHRVLRGRRGRIIFSGIQPTGVPHLGNYLGALKSWVEIQNASRKGDLNYYSVVDLHAITRPQDPLKISRWRTETFASLLAVGLDPKKSNMFFQSQVAQHAELMWLLSTTASTGYLSRMTQWKTKLDLSENASVGEGSSKEKLKLGLFSYPVLQAADILLYDATHVPIGGDQMQHLEFTRNLAKGFNSHYDQVKNAFVVPEAILSPAKRIMSLSNPENKMSKSDQNENSRILITDNQEAIHAKIKAAITDSEDGISYDVEKRPGISNLIDIVKFTSQDSVTSTEIAKECQDMSKKTFKTFVADSVVTCLGDIREKYESILADPRIVPEAAQSGAYSARLAARTKIRHIHKIMGLDYHPALNTQKQ